MQRVKENIALEFDMFSSDYTRDMVNCVPHYLKLMSSLVETIPSSMNPKDILDMGSGNGNLTTRLMKVFPDANFTLVDASPEMLKICQNRFTSFKLNIFEGYFHDYNFEPKSFDLVAASFSFHHIDSNQKQEIFSSIYKCLRPGGVFASCDLMIHKNDEDHPELLKEWGTFVNSNHDNDEKWKWIMEHYDTFDKPDNFKNQMKWLEEAGFSEVTIAWRQGYWVSLQAVK